MPSYIQAVKVERERPVVMAVLEALTGVLRTCGTLAVQHPGRINDLCIVLKTVLQKKVSGAGGLWGEEVSGPRRVQLCPSHHHRRKEKSGEPTLTELCLPQTACQNSEEEEEEDDDDDQVKFQMKEV